ncbi:MAG: hypothetical protein Q8M17_10705 [Actinomycetota bacterium]|nr:hypothetical protein [Actinomycetota bacterium]
MGAPRRLVLWLASRRRLIKALEAEREWRMKAPSTLLDSERRARSAEGKLDDAKAEARTAKNALEAARRERDHEARVAHDAVTREVVASARQREAEDALAEIKRTGWAPLGMALVTYTPDHMVPGSAAT